MAAMPTSRHAPQSKDTMRFQAAGRRLLSTNASRTAFAECKSIVPGSPDTAYRAHQRDKIEFVIPQRFDKQFQTLDFRRKDGPDVLGLLQRRQPAVSSNSRSMHNAVDGAPRMRASVIARILASRSAASAAASRTSPPTGLDLANGHDNARNALAGDVPSIQRPIPARRKGVRPSSRSRAE